MTDAINDADGSSDTKLTQKQADENWKMYCERQERIRFSKLEGNKMNDMNDLPQARYKETLLKGSFPNRLVEGATKRLRKQDGYVPVDEHRNTNIILSAIGKTLLWSHGANSKFGEYFNELEECFSMYDEEEFDE